MVRRSMKFITKAPPSMETLFRRGFSVCPLGERFMKVLAMATSAVLYCATALSSGKPAIVKSPHIPKEKPAVTKSVHTPILRKAWFRIAVRATAYVVDARARGCSLNTARTASERSRVPVRSLSTAAYSLAIPSWDTQNDGAAAVSSIDVRTASMQRLYICRLGRWVPKEIVTADGDNGTLSGIDAIESGTQTPDVAWFAQDHYFGLTDTKHLIKKSTPTMISPVILGVKQFKAKELGWLGRRIGWKDVEAAIASGKFHYAMASPTTSNSGFSAVIGITSAFSNAGDAILTKDVNKTKLTEFFSGQKLMSGSSGWLASAYQNSEPDLDGMINYESIILELDDAKLLHERLVPIYPAEGAVIANYPLVLLNDAKSTDYSKVVQYIRTPAFQKEIMAGTHRRPILPQIRLASEFDKNLLIDTPFPASRSTVDAILGDYLNKRRLAAHAFYARRSRRVRLWRPDRSGWAAGNR
jgi:hypothetical protein